MNDTTAITIIFALFALAEVLQVWLLRSAVVSIKKRMDELAPADKRLGTVLAETVYDFMRMISENKNGEAQVVGSFIRGAAVAAFDEVKGKIPLLGQTDNLDANLEKISKRNPWAGLAIGVAQMLAPAIQSQLQKGGGESRPQIKSGRGNLGYG